MSLQQRTISEKGDAAEKRQPATLPVAKSVMCFRPEAGRSLGGEDQNPRQSISCACLNCWKQSHEDSAGSPFPFQKQIGDWGDSSVGKMPTMKALRPEFGSPGPK